VTQDNLPAQCAVVDHSNFQAFFGQTFASHAQFVAGILQTFDLLCFIVAPQYWYVHSFTQKEIKFISI